LEWLTTSTILRDLRDYQNNDVWGRFIARFRPPLVRFARQVGLSESDAEDVAQEALVAFAESYRKGGYDRQRGRLSQWLFGFAFRCALKERRRAGQHAHDVLDSDPSSNAPAPLIDEQAATTTWDREWEAALVEQCLNRVRQEFAPDNCRAFELMLFESCSPSEAATRLSVPVKSVYNAKHRILKRLRELRSEYDDAA